MATVATVNSRVDQAITAMDGGDWTTALTHLLAAKAALAALPDSQEGPSEVSWDRDAIDALVEDVRRQQASASGSTSGAVQRTRVQWSPVTG